MDEYLWNSLSEAQDQLIDIIGDMTQDLDNEEKSSMLTKQINGIVAMSFALRKAIADGDKDGATATIVSISALLSLVSACLDINVIDDPERPEIGERIDKILDMFI